MEIDGLWLGVCVIGFVMLVGCLLEWVVVSCLGGVKLVLAMVLCGSGVGGGSRSVVMVDVLWPGTVVDVKE